MRTSELTGADLNWAVCIAEYGYGADYKTNRYSTDWAQGGPLIEREKIEVFRRDEEWYAYSSLSKPEDFHGNTPLIAAMRCYVASKLGDNIDIPKGL